MPITREGNPTEAFNILMGWSKKRKPVSPKIPGYRTSLIRTNNYSKREPLDDADDDTENDSYYSTASETSFLLKSYIVQNLIKIGQKLKCVAYQNDN
jgi:hypothetical protein